MDVNSMLNDSPSSFSTAAQASHSLSAGQNSGTSMDHRIEPVVHDMPMVDAPVNLSQPLPSVSPRRTRGSKKPADIQIENGSSSSAAKQSAQPSPHAPKQSSKLSYPPQLPTEESVKKLGEVIMGVDEFIVPISLPASVYDSYLKMVEKYTPEHSQFMTDLNPDIKTIRAMERMIVELDSIVTHPDLLDKSVFDESIDEAGGELHYGRLSSHKLGFLYRLLDQILASFSDGIPSVLAETLKDRTKLQMAIVVQDGKLFEILTRFLLLMNIPFTIVDDGQSYHEERKDNLDLILVSSSFERPAELPSVDIIYALDSSFDRQGEIAKALKGDGGKKTRILFPWVFASPEHIRACMPVTEGLLDPLRTFTQILVQTRPELGSIASVMNGQRFKPVAEAGKEVSKWILDGFVEPFPLSGFGQVTLHGLDLIFKPSNKRQLDDSEEEGSTSPSKRRRTSEELLDEEVPSNASSPNDEIAALREQVKVLKKRVRSQDMKLLEQNTTLKATNEQLDSAKVALVRCEDEKARLEAQLLQETKTTYGLMHQCDRALNQLSNAREKNQNLMIEKEALQAALKAKSMALEKLKVNLDETRIRNRELENARVQATASNAMAPSPSDTTESPFLRSENEEQRKEIASLKRKAQSSEESRAYAFHLYQDASSRAAELAGEVQEKQIEIDRLIPLAQNHSLLALQAAGTSELETTKFALERSLVEKEELEEQLRRGNTRPGMNTRGQSSAPPSSRSPRVAISPPPVPRSRASSRQPGSRATSPTGRASHGQRRALPGRLAES